MIIFPAIDILDGKCVRLFKGDYETNETVTAASPLETARKFEEEGAEWIHLVDLNGARYARPTEPEIFKEIAANTSLKTEVGGGIRTMKAIEDYLEAGLTRVILGSAALRDPKLTQEAVRTFGERIAIGIDAKDRRVLADGWLEASDVDYIELSKRMEQMGVRTIIFTDISKDGTLAGPNAEQLDELNRAVSCDITASGGIRDIEDIRNMKRLGLYGTICGKSIYKGTLDLAEAIRVANGN